MLRTEVGRVLLTPMQVSKIAGNPATRYSVMCFHPLFSYCSVFVPHSVSHCSPVDFIKVCQQYLWQFVGVYKSGMKAGVRLVVGTVTYGSGAALDISNTTKK